MLRHFVTERLCPSCNKPLKLSNHHTYHCTNEDCSVYTVRFNRVGRVLSMVLAAEPLTDSLVHPRREAFWT